MSLTQGFPSTFSATQKTNEVLHNLDNETKKIYNDVNAIMAADGHAHTGNGSDGAAITHVATAYSATTATTAGACSGNSATATILETARTIAGISFNGSANIEIPYANLTGKPEIPSAAAYDTAHSFAINGYQKFSNGLIIQWGVVTTSISVIFPISFNIVFNVTLGMQANSGVNRNVGAYDITTTGFTAYREGTTTLSYIAIGY